MPCSLLHVTFKKSPPLHPSTFQKYGLICLGDGAGLRSLLQRLKSHHWTRTLVYRITAPISWRDEGSVEGPSGFLMVPTFVRGNNQQGRLTFLYAPPLPALSQAYAEPHAIQYPEHVVG